MTAFSGTRSRPILTSMMLLNVTVIVNLWMHNNPEVLDQVVVRCSNNGSSSNNNRSSVWDYFLPPRHFHNNTSMAPIFASLFRHANWEHVAQNMIGLWVTGRSIFVDPSWENPFAFPWIYFGSHLLSACGCRVLSHWLDLQWKRKIVRERASWSGWVPNVVRDAYSTLSNAPQVARLRLWQYVPVVGASAAVYGIAGAGVYKSAAVPSRNRGPMDKLAALFWIPVMLSELSRTPLSLERISSAFEDGIDHAAHLFGFVGGFLLAAAWDYFSRTGRGEIQNSSE